MPPKIHKPDVSLRPIVSACGTSTYKLSKFFTKIMQIYTVKNFPFVKESKGLADSLKGKSINTDETLVFFDVSALFISIPVPVALEVINRKLNRAHFTRRNTRLLGTLPPHLKRQTHHTSGNCAEQLCVFFSTKVL